MKVNLYSSQTATRRLRSLGGRWLPCLALVVGVLLLPVGSFAQTFTWIGAGSNDLFNNSANWQSGSVPGTSNPASGNTLVFGTESGSSPNYIVTLNQSNNQNQQRVGTFIFTSGAGAYQMNRSGVQEYTLYGVSAGSADPGDFTGIVNQSNSLITFNVPINADAQGGSSPMARLIWDSGTGGLQFNNTIFFNNNAKDLSLRGSEDIRFTAATGLNNITGSSAVMVVRMDPAATVQFDGVITDMPGIRLASGTLYLAKNDGGDIIDDRGAASRRTQLDMRGGTLLLADSGTQLAEFKGTMTLSRDSNVTGLIRSTIDLGSGGLSTIQFANSSSAVWAADTLL